MQFFVLYQKRIQAYCWLQDFYLLKKKKKYNKKKTATDRILASDRLYLFINFSVETLFKVARLCFSFSTPVHIKDERVEIHCAFFFPHFD